MLFGYKFWDLRHGYRLQHHRTSTHFMFHSHLLNFPKQQNSPAFRGCSEKWWRRSWACMNKTWNFQAKEDVKWGWGWGVAGWRCGVVMCMGQNMTQIQPSIIHRLSHQLCGFAQMPVYDVFTVCLWRRREKKMAYGFKDMRREWTAVCTKTKIVPCIFYCHGAIKQKPVKAKKIIHSVPEYWRNALY